VAYRMEKFSNLQVSLISVSVGEVWGWAFVLRAMGSLYRCRSNAAFEV
jgi:hypothetical protein